MCLDAAQPQTHLKSSLVYPVMNYISYLHRPFGKSLLPFTHPLFSSTHECLGWNCSMKWACECIYPSQKSSFLLIFIDSRKYQWVKKKQKNHICLIKWNLSSLTDLLSACLQSEARWSVHLFILFWIYCPRKIISWCKYRDSANDSEIYTNVSIKIKMKALFEDITVTYFPHPHPQRVVDCL